MAFVVAAGNWSEEGYKSAALNRTGAGTAIGGVRARDCGGGSGTIVTIGGWRVDKQNPSATHQNIQVQRNGVVNEKSSIAGVLFLSSLIGQIGNFQNPDVAKAAQAVARDTELTRAIQGALTQSAGTWSIGGPAANQHGRFRFYTVTGTFSS